MGRPIEISVLEGKAKPDQQVTRELRAAGWKVLRIWEHRLRLSGPVMVRIRWALAADPPNLAQPKK